MQRTNGFVVPAKLGNVSGGKEPARRLPTTRVRRPGYRDSAV